MCHGKAFVPQGRIETLKTKILGMLSSLFFPVLSGLVLALAFPKGDMGWLAWFGLVPLLAAISNKSPGRGFLLALVCGMVFFAWIFGWILKVPGYEFYHHAILMVYFGSFFGLFGLTFCFFAKRTGLVVSFFAAPFIWVALEYIRSHFSFMALPWGLLAHSQHENLVIIQIASLAGTFGISFLIVLTNSGSAAIVLAVLARFRKVRSSIPHMVSKSGAIAVAGTAALLVFLSIGHGREMLSRPIAGKDFKVSLLQGNIEQDRKWDPASSGYIMRTYEDLSRLASRDNPDLIIWPEAATPGHVLKRPDLLSQLTSLIGEADTHFLVGSSEFPKFAKDLQGKGKSANTVIFFSPQGKVLGQYLKINLLPFSEYIPFEGIAPWPHFLIPEKKSSHIAGKEATLFSIHGVTFAAIICWEGIFPELVRRFVKEGAQFIVNVANEAWFGETAGSYQFLSMNVFRAVENRVFMARCVNTGISCFIDPCGRVFNRLRDEAGHELFVRGILTDNVVPMAALSIYTRYGDWLPWLCISCAVGLLAVNLRYKKKRMGS